MDQTTCKKCKSPRATRSGKVRGKQRYKCSGCGRHYVQGDNRGKISPEAKALGLLLYGSGKAGQGMIARLFNVSRPAVLYWVKNLGRSLPEPEVSGVCKEATVDEMWHFINEKNKKYGYGGPQTVATTRPLDALLAIVMPKRLKKPCEKLKDVVKMFYTGHWEAYKKAVPKEKSAQGKAHTVKIEQDNSNTRHYLGRMTRRTKTVSKSVEMLDISLRIAYCLNEGGFYSKYQKQFLAIF